MVLVFVAVPIPDRAVDERENLVLDVGDAVDEGHARVRAKALRARAIDALEVDAHAAIDLEARVRRAVHLPIVTLVLRDRRSARLGPDDLAFEAHDPVRALALGRGGVAQERQLDRPCHQRTCSKRDALSWFVPDSGSDYRC